MVFKYKCFLWLLFSTRAYWKPVYMADIPLKDKSRKHRGGPYPQGAHSLLSCLSDSPTRLWAPGGQALEIIWKDIYNSEWSLHAMLALLLVLWSWQWLDYLGGMKCRKIGWAKEETGCFFYLSVCWDSVNFCCQAQPLMPWDSEEFRLRSDIKFGSAADLFCAWSILVI